MARISVVDSFTSRMVSPSQLCQKPLTFLRWHSLSCEIRYWTIICSFIIPSRKWAVFLCVYLYLNLRMIGFYFRMFWCTQLMTITFILLMRYIQMLSFLLSVFLFTWLYMFNFNIKSELNLYCLLPISRVQEKEFFVN